MTLNEFIAKYDNKFVEYHSYGAGAQFMCVDLTNQYIVEVLGLQAVIGTNAQDVPSKVNPNDYDYILNTPTGVPQAGDIVIFKSADNVGHISIFIEGNANLFTSFDQNYPLGSPCHKVSHNYRNVLGWLHPKKATIPDNQESLIIDSNNWKAICTRFDISDPQQVFDKVDGLVVERDNLKKERDNLKTNELNLSKEIVKMQPKADEWDKVLSAFARDGVTDFLTLDGLIRTLREIGDHKLCVPKTECEKKVQTAKDQAETKCLIRLSQQLDKMSISQVFSLLVKKIKGK